MKLVLSYRSLWFILNKLGYIIVWSIVIIFWICRIVLGQVQNEIKIISYISKYFSVFTFLRIVFAREDGLHWCGHHTKAVLKWLNCCLRKEQIQTSQAWWVLVINISFSQVLNCTLILLSWLNILQFLPLITVYKGLTLIIYVIATGSFNNFEFFEIEANGCIAHTMIQIIRRGNNRKDKECS